MKLRASIDQSPEPRRPAIDVVFKCEGSIKLQLSKRRSRPIFTGFAILLTSAVGIFPYLVVIVKINSVPPELRNSLPVPCTENRCSIAKPAGGSNRHVVGAACEASGSRDRPMVKLRRLSRANIHMDPHAVDRESTLDSANDGACHQGRDPSQEPLSIGLKYSKESRSRPDPSRSSRV